MPCPLRPPASDRRQPTWPDVLPDPGFYTSLYPWVRRIEQSGHWSQLPVTLTLRAGPAAAVGYTLVLFIVTAIGLLPVAAAATALDTGEAKTGAQGAVVLAAILLSGAAIWLSGCIFRSLWHRPRITIDAQQACLYRTLPWGRHRQSVPIADFTGLVVRPVTTLDGSLFDLHLVHPTVGRSLLLSRSKHIDPATLTTISQALTKPILACDPSLFGRSADRHGPAGAADRYDAAGTLSRHDTANSQTPLAVSPETVAPEQAAA